MQDFDSVKAHFLEVARLKYFITMMMKKHHLIDDIVVKNVPEAVTPFYGRIVDHDALVVEFSKGVPNLICTNWGGVPIESAKLCRGYPADYDRFIRDLDKNLRFVEEEPIMATNYDEIGPRCAVSRLPWSQAKLPIHFNDEVDFTDKTIGSKEETAQLAEIYYAVNRQLIASGHPEMVASAPKAVEKPLFAQPEHKKRVCIIAGQLKQFLKHKEPEKDNL